MYESFFGFKENPFNLTPDPRYLYLSSYHREALDHLLYGINERKGFIAIIGGVGTGKTTLCRALLNRLDQGTSSALILNSSISEWELLRAINEEFGVEKVPVGGSKKVYIDMLNHFLLQNFGRGGNAVILIDEAQNLSHAVLEQVRMLSNLETEREKLLQIVLVGQSELKDVLAAPSLRQLDERIMVRYHLKPLDSRDTRGYVEHRLVVAGGSGHLTFTSGAYRRIYRYSLGNPRRINALCDRALLIAYAQESFTLDKEIIDRANWEVNGERKMAVRGSGWGRRRSLVASLLILMLLLVAAYGGWSLKDKQLPWRSFVQKSPFALQALDTRSAELIDKSPPPGGALGRASDIFMDDTSSMALLFSLFEGGLKDHETDPEKIQPALVSITMRPEYHVLLKRPFRVKRRSAPPGARARAAYLLVKAVTAEGVIALDGHGDERPLEREFLMENWGGQVSFVYPYQWGHAFPAKGSEGSRVLELQEALKAMGYMVETTGRYDEKTAAAVTKFQREFGLPADGTVGSRTSALLYQMSEP